MTSELVEDFGEKCRAAGKAVKEMPDKEETFLRDIKRFDTAIQIEKRLAQT